MSLTPTPLPPNSSFFVNSTLTARGRQLVVNQGFGPATAEVAGTSLWSATGNLPTRTEVENKTREQGTLGAWVWSCDNWDKKKDPGITMLINPESVQWVMPFRWSRVNTFGGTIFHRWQNFYKDPTDLPTLKIRMNTGNLLLPSMIRRVLDARNSPGTNYGTTFSADDKRAAFFKFCSLTHQSAFTDDGEPNLISVQYKSVLFGQINLYGIFTDPLTFTEDAMKPFNVVYEIGLTVVRQNPQFGSPEQFSQVTSGS